MAAETSETPPTTPRPRRTWPRRAAAVVLALVLVTGGYVVGRTADARPSSAASSPSPSSSSTPSASPSSTTPPSPGRSSRSDGVKTCDRLNKHVAPLFAYKIGGKTVTPELVTRHQLLDDGRTGCRWEDEGSTLSLIAGPDPIKRPWVVLDRAWDDPTPWACHPQGGNRPCGSSMWESSTGAGLIASWSHESRRCIAASQGVDIDRDKYSLWGLCAGWLTGEWS